MTRLYPRSWRDRYGAEFEELLKTGHGDLRTLADVAWSGLRERVFPSHRLPPDQATQPASFHSFCVRAPWPVFSVAPVSLLAGSYLLAYLIYGWAGKSFCRRPIRLWGGGPRHRFANLYFQFGKYFYGSAPILVGWLIAIVAARQTVKVVWPWLGFLLIAWTYLRATRLLLRNALHVWSPFCRRVRTSPKCSGRSRPWSPRPHR